MAQWSFEVSQSQNMLYQTARQNYLKSYRHFRGKLKHVLWLRDLKASLSNSLEKSIYKTPSTGHILEEAVGLSGWIRLLGQNREAWAQKNRLNPALSSVSSTVMNLWWNLDKIVLQGGVIDRQTDKNLCKLDSLGQTFF